MPPSGDVLFADATADAARWSTVGLVGAAVVGGAVTVIVKWLDRNSDEQDEETVTSVSEFIRAYDNRGDLVKGYQADFEAQLARFDRLEREREQDRLAAAQQEQQCLDALEHAHTRLAVLEERLGIGPTDH